MADKNIIELPDLNQDFAGSMACYAAEVGYQLVLNLPIELSIWNDRSVSVDVIDSERFLIRADIKSRCHVITTRRKGGDYPSAKVSMSGAPSTTFGLSPATFSETNQGIAVCCPIKSRRNIIARHYHTSSTSIEDIALHALDLIYMVEETDRFVLKRADDCTWEFVPTPPKPIRRTR